MFLPVVLSVVGPSSYNAVSRASPVSKEMKVLKTESFSEEVTKLSEDVD